MFIKARLQTFMPIRIQVQTTPVCVSTPLCQFHNGSVE